MNVLNQIPILRILLPLLLGIVVAQYVAIQTLYYYWILGILIVLYFIFSLIKNLNASYKYRWVFGLLIYSQFFVLGNLVSHIKNYSKNTQLSQLSDQLIIGEISEQPAIKDKIVKCQLTVTGIQSNNAWIKTDGKVVVFFQKNNESIQLQMGDIVSFFPEFKEIQNTKNPDEFDYKKYLAYHLIFKQAYLKSSDWKLIEKSTNNSIFSWADNIRRKMVKWLQDAGLTENELDVASALILGYKSNIEAQLKSAYTNSGTMHVLAVSGLHVAIVYMIVNFLLKFFERISFGKIIKGFILLAVIWFYALITGFSPSVLRSAAMFSFIVLAEMVNRRNNFFNTLSASALLLLLINPNMLFDIGFQLSYSAVIGIVLIQPWFDVLLKPKTWLNKYIWDLLTVSMAAQIATLPLGLYYFHQFPNYFLIANLLVIPISFFVLCLGLLTLCFSFYPLLASWLGLLLKYSVVALNESVIFIDKLPYAITDRIKFSFTDTILVYFIIGCLLLLLSTRKYRYSILACLGIIVLLIGISFDKINLLNQKKLVVYNIPKHTAINFIDGNDNILLADKSLSSEKVKFHVGNNWINKGVLEEKVFEIEQLQLENSISNLYKINNTNLFLDKNHFQFFNNKMAIVNQNFKVFIPKKPLKIDYLIWTQNANVSLSKVATMYNFKKLIIDSSNSTYVGNKLCKEAALLSIEVWNVANNGAFETDV